MAAANLFQEAEERDAETRLCETPSGHEVTPVLWMLRYENFDPLVKPNMSRADKIGSCIIY